MLYSIENDVVRSPDGENFIKMKNSAKTNIRINKKTGVAIVYFLTIAALVLSSLFLGLNSPIGTTNAMSGPPMVAQRVTQFANGDAANSGNNFGMPTAFDHDFVVSHTGAQPGPGVHPYGTFTYTLTHNGTSIVPPAGGFTSFTNPASGEALTNVPVARDANSVSTAIHALLVATGTNADTRIRLEFDNIRLARNDVVHFTNTAIWVYTGSIIGDLSNFGAGGLLHLTGAAIQRVYLYDLYLENQGSVRFDIGDPRYTSGAQHTNILGSTRARGVTASANMSLFVLGDTSIRVTNEAQLRQRRSILTPADFLGYYNFAMTARHAGRHRSLSVSEQNLRAGNYNAHFGAWLAAAYGAPITMPTVPGMPGNEFHYPATPEFLDLTTGHQARYNMYSADTLEQWLDSGSFVRDFVSNVTGADNNRTFIISGANHQTGNAITFSSPGGLIIDTSGEISSFAGASTEGPAGTTRGVAPQHATIRISGNAFNNPFGNNTRMYIRRGTLLNRTYDIHYGSQAVLTGILTDPFPTTGAGGLGLGAVIRCDNSLAAGFGNHLLAGGTFESGGWIFRAPTSGTAAAPGFGNNLTVGCPDGILPGPTMRTGIAHDGNIIRFRGVDGSSLGSGNLLLPVQMFELGANARISDSNVDRRISVVFLNGNFIVNRGTFLTDLSPTNGGTAIDVHLMGGTIETGQYANHAVNVSNDGFIRLQGENNLASNAGVRTGSTFTMYGAGETVSTIGGGSVLTHGASISANVTAIQGTNAGLQGGLLFFYSGMCRGGSEDLPLFDIRGGTITNTNNSAAVAPIIHVFRGNAGRVGYITGGEFSSPIGIFLLSTRTANDIVMTDGLFEHTQPLSIVQPAVIAGNAFVTGTWDVGPHNYITGQPADANNDGTLSNLTGAVFLNGGEIRSRGTTANRGLVHATKANNTVAIVMGHNRDSNMPNNVGGISSGVTTLTNSGNSPMISVSEATWYSAVVRQYFNTSNSKVVINRVDFNYVNFPALTPVNFAGCSILAVTQRHLEETYDLRHFPTLYFTGTLAGLQGFITASVNTVVLSDTFDNAGFTGDPIGLMIENLNNEAGLNRSIIQNVGTHRNDFEIRGYEIGANTLVLSGGWPADPVLPTLRGLMTNAEGTASYLHDVEVVDGNLMNINRIHVGFFTPRYGNGITQSPANSGITFPQGNQVIFPDNNRHSEFDGYLWMGIDTITLGTYGDLFSSFSGDTFTEGYSVGLPRLTIPGYTHIGWTYSGYHSPRNRRQMRGLLAGGVTLIDAGGHYTRPNIFRNNVWVNSTTPLHSVYSHMIVAVWALGAPTLNEGVTAVTPQVATTISGFDAAETTITTAAGITTVTRTYDAHPTSFTVNPWHEILDPAFPALGGSAAVAWYRSDTNNWVGATLITNTNAANGPTISGNNLANLIDVRDSGWYRVVVTLTDDIGLTSYRAHVFHLTITRQIMTVANITMPTRPYNEQYHTVLNPGPGATGAFSVVDNFGRVLANSTNLDRIGDSGAAPHGTADFWTAAHDIRTHQMRTAGGHPFVFNFIHNYYGAPSAVFTITAPTPMVSFINLNPTAFSQQVTPIAALNLIPLGAHAADGFDYPTAGWPANPVVPGYTFGGWWTADNVRANPGEQSTINGNHSVSARWTLNEATGTTIAGTNWDNNTSTFAFVFDRSLHSITASGLVNGAVADLNANPNAITYIYFWYRGNTIIGVGDTLSLMNIETGAFRLRVQAIDNEGRTSTFTRDFTVNISAHEITTVTLPSVDWDGRIQHPVIEIMHGTYRLIEGIDFTVARPVGEVRNAGTYDFIFTFSGNYTGVVTATFEIVMAVRVTFGNLQPPISPVAATAPAYVIPTNDGRYPALPIPTLPTGFAGYEFVGWNFGVTRVNANNLLGVSANHELTAVWRLLEADVVLSVGTNFDADFNNIGVNEYELAFVFDRTSRAITATPTIDGISAGLVFSYLWRESTPTGTVVDTNNARSFMNVLQSGVYYLVVTAEDMDGNRRTVTAIRINVVITPRSIDDSFISVNIPWVRYAGFNLFPSISMTHTVNAVEHQLFSGVDFTFNPINAREVGNHAITITAVNPNYTGTRTANFEIRASVLIMFNSMLGLPPATMSAVFENNQYYFPELPAPANIPAGYVFRGWSLANTTGIYIANENFVDSDGGELIPNQSTRTLTAVFRLRQVEIANLAAMVEDINRTFDGNPTVRIPNITFFNNDAPSVGNVNIVFEWTRGISNGGVWEEVTGAGAIHFVGASKSFVNVADSGYWRLRVTANGLFGLYTVDTVYFDVNINHAQLATPNITRNGHILSWNGVEHAVRYEISVSGVNGGAWTPVTAFGYSNGVFSYDILTYLRPVSNQTFRIRAISEDPNRPYAISNTISYRHLPAPNAPVISRETGTNIIYWNAVYLNWIDGGSVGYATHYRIYRNGVAVATIGPAVWANNLIGAPESFDITDFLVFGNNRITVRAIWQSDWISPWSEHSNYIDIFHTVTLGAPTNLAVNTSGVLSWTGVASSEGYIVTVSGITLGQVSGTSLNINSLLELGGNVITVQAVHSNPHIIDSAVTSYTHIISRQLETPTDLNIISGTLVWSAVAGADYYEIQINDGGLISVSGTSFELTGLTAGANTIRVRAVSNNENLLTSLHAEIEYTHTVPVEHSYTVVFMNGTSVLEELGRDGLSTAELDYLLANKPMLENTATHRFSSWRLTEQVRDVNVTTMTFEARWELLTTEEEPETFDWWWLAVGTGAGTVMALILCLGIALKKKGGR